MHKPTLKAALLAAALTGLTTTGAFAEEAAAEDTGFPGDFSATLAFTTNYVFRGLTQTQDDPAIQGSFDYTHPIGFYAGVWASNIDFGDGALDDDANLEVDFYTGFANSIDKFNYKLGFIYYMYPGANDPGGALEYNYWEVLGSLGYDFGVASVTGSVYYSPDFFGGIDDSVYYNGAVAIPLPFLPLDAKLDGWVGYNQFLDNPGDYIDWSVGLTFNLEGFNLGFRYTDTDISPDAQGFDEAFIFSISRTL